MIDGLWTIEINSALELFTTGIIVLDRGRVLGGDTRFFYIGTYDIDVTGTVHAKVTFTHYAGPHLSVVGVVNELTVILSGTPAEDVFELRGHIEGLPGSNILSIRLTRRAGPTA